VEKTPKYEVRVSSPDQRKGGTRDKGDSPVVPELLLQDRNDVVQGVEERV
jgi:hypothetical protein